MATCENCIHYEVCTFHIKGVENKKCPHFLNTADVAPRAEVIAEYRKEVYAKMGKYTVFGREYIQRIMREVEKKYIGE